MIHEHVITRVRHPLRFRRLAVTRVEPLTPGMRRVVLAGDELEGFTSLGFDDHVKLFFPDASGRLPEPVVGETGLSFPHATAPPPARDFTPRRYDPDRQELVIDFGIHGSGPATTWAVAATPGSPLGVAGPRGSVVISDTFDWNLLVGDETALPAIARRLEELPAHVAAIAVVEVDDDAEHQPIGERSGIDVRWVHRRGADVQPIERVVESLTLPPGQGFAWVAGEASMARRVRQHFIEDRHFDKRWVKAAAYWRIGATGKHEVLEDP